MLNWLNEIFKTPRYAFLTALVSRPAGLLVFSIWIAHRWAVADIALFESFSVFQFLLFFAWLPAWGNVSLQQTIREDELSQKPFPFSNIFFGWVLLTGCYLIFSLFWASLLPGIEFYTHGITIYILISFYYFLQVHIFKNYIEGSLDTQWLLAGVLFFTWVLLGLLAGDFESYMRYQVIAHALLLMTLKRGKIQGIKIQWDFWKQVLVYSIYSFTGGLGPILAAYFVQFRFGLGHELNWFRYGTRELPILPAWLAGFGQSHLKDNLHSETSLEVLKDGVSRQIQFIVLPLAALILFSKPLFSLLFGQAFMEASGLMSIFLLIYIPRMVFPQIVLQSRQLSSVLLITGLIELCGMVIAALIWVPGFGLEAIVWILVAGAALEKLIYIVYLRYRHNIPANQYIPVVPFLMYAMVLLSAYVLKSSAGL